MNGVVVRLIGLLILCHWGWAEAPPHVDQPFSQEMASHYTWEMLGIEPGVGSIDLDAEGRPVVSGRNRFARFERGKWQRLEGAAIGVGSEVPHPQGLRVDQFVSDGLGRRAAGGLDGLYEQAQEGGPWKKVTASDGKGRSWGVEDVLAVTYDSQGNLWFGVEAGLGQRGRDGQWRFFEGRDGLPYNQFTCAAAGEDGSIWVGCRIGLIRYREGHWHYRQGRRWLLDDHVHGMVVDSKNAAWVVTEAGVSRLYFEAMSLHQKAEYYEREIDRLFKRTEYGYIAPVGLGASGDRSRVSQQDSDNDGLWTSMYGAGQCFAYAATKDPRARRRAKEAFEALRFLQVVTQGSKTSPPKGFVARTIRESSLPDPNQGRIERDRARQETVDRLWKVYQPRWPLSADGRWYWKGDTSSDELDGHYFFYPLYHDLVAETETERERVRTVVRDLTDHLLQHGFNLVDHDGRPTRWGVFGPQSLNRDPNWQVERGLNSLSMLAYLTVAAYLTDEPRFHNAIERLKRQHAYDSNAMVPKVQRGIGSGNQSDDEMAFMGFYNLLRYSKDRALTERLSEAFYQYWTLERPEINPFFNFAYAACAQGRRLESIWGSHEIGPWQDWLQDSVATLKAFPLDRVDWGHRNSHRIDLIDLSPQQSIDLHSPNAPGSRGTRVDGRVLPVDERFFNHWNTDPFRYDTGGNGRGLGCGTVFLLPYYMGLYHGYIKVPPAGG